MTDPTSTGDLLGTGSPLDSYRARVLAAREDADLANGPDAFPRVDELVTASGLRDHQQALAAEIVRAGPAGLSAARTAARRQVQNDGIRYGSTHADGELAPDRRWVVDPLPVVLGADEWARLEHALEQRAVLLDLILRDIYGEGRLLRDGLVPPEVVLGHGGFVHQAVGTTLPGDHLLVLAATDLGRDADGTWTVVGDHTGVPTGAGYAMADRRIVTRAMPHLHREVSIERMRAFFHTMAGSLRRVAPASDAAPRVVLLSPGSAGETAYEQGFLAALLGFPLVESEDLTMLDGRVCIRAGTRPTPVDVVLRRVDTSFADPLDLRPDSQLGVPGLLEAGRRGTVSVVNPLGSEVLENPGLLPFLPQLARTLLGADLLAPSAPTWWCGDDVQRGHVLANLDTLVLKPLTHGSAPTVRGWETSREEREDLRRRIEAQPWAWCGQAPVPLSTAPVVTSSGLEPRRFVLRAFGVARGDRYRFLPGGLGRVAPDRDTVVVSHHRGALAKDVWVLAPTDASPVVVPSRDEPVWARRVSGPALAPRVADNLFWFGRYAARADSTTRLIRVVDDLIDDHHGRPGTTGAAAMSIMVTAASTLTRIAREHDETRDDVLWRMVGEEFTPGSIAYASRRLTRAAQEIRDLLSQDVWHTIGRLERTLGDLATNPGPLQPRLHDVLAALLAVAGIMGENMVRDASWGFLDAGARMERAQFTLELVRTALCPDVADTGHSDRASAVDAYVVESVLEAGESSIMHRRRTATGSASTTAAHSAVELLLLDETNPRSVTFALAQLAEALRVVGDVELGGRAGELGHLASGIDVPSACAGTRGDLRDVLDDLSERLRRLSDDLTLRHFRRPATQRQMSYAWSPVRPGTPDALVWRADTTRSDGAGPDGGRR